MSHIETEINEQPAVIQSLLDREHASARMIAAQIQAFDPAFIYIAARGTSDNAARYAQYLFSIHTHLPVALATPSVHTLYLTTPRLNRALVVGISQSGRSEDIRKVLADGKAQGALTLSITNAPDSPLATQSDFHIDVGAGPERSVAATKTYTAQLTAVALLNAALTDTTPVWHELQRIPHWVQQTIEQSNLMASWVQRYRYMERFVTLGRGYNYATAFEISLKIKELCYVAGEGYSEADFQHGPVALIEGGFPVIVVAPKGATLSSMWEFMTSLQSKHAETIVFSNEAEFLAKATRSVALPHDLPEWLSPIAAVIPGQHFAMYLALEKGHHVDEPRGLNKITSTR